MAIYGTFVVDVLGTISTSSVTPFSDNNDFWGGLSHNGVFKIPAREVPVGSLVYVFINYNQVSASRGGSSHNVNVNDVVHATDGEVPQEPQLPPPTFPLPVDTKIMMTNLDEGWNREVVQSALDTFVFDNDTQHISEIRTGNEILGVIEFAPGANVGIIHADTSPQGASIFINGLDTGMTTPQDIERPVGSYTITYKLTNYHDSTIVVDVIMDTTVNAIVTLIPVTEPPPTEPPTEPEVPTETHFPFSAPANWQSEFTTWYSDLVNWLPKYGTETPDSMVDSAVKVFTGKDPVTGADIEPDKQDYANLGLLIVGAAGMATSFARGVASRIGGLKATQGFRGAAEMTTAAEGEVVIGNAAGRVMAAEVAAVPASGIGFWSVLKASALKNPVFTILGGAFLLTQFDATGWFFGLAPEPMHRRLEGIAKGIRGDLIRLNQLVKNQNWEAAGELVPLIRNNLKEGRRMTTTLPVGFWEKFGFTVESAIGMFDTLELSLNAYVSQYPAIVASIEELPEEIITDSFEVVDGDTIITDETYTIRFLGIDAHEIGTIAGLAEKDYLESLISGKTVTVKIDPFNQIDQYGRVLGVVFVEGSNMSLKMLARFGEDILPPTKFHDRNKYVDWDENRIVAESRQLPIELPIAAPLAANVGKLNITSTPTHAKIFIDDIPTGLTTAETMDNVPSGQYQIRLQREGYEDFVTNVIINTDKTTETFADLVRVGEAPRKLTKADIENQFKVGTMTEETARANLTLLGFTFDQTEGFIQTWVAELAFGASSPESDQTGAIFITSNPFYAEIWVDGVNTELITSQTIYVTPDVVHEIRLKFPGYDDWFREVTVASGEKKEFRGTLKFTVV